MPHRIEVAAKDKSDDVRGARLKTQIQSDLGIKADSVNVIDVYTIDGDLSPKQLKKLQRELFADPITERASSRPFATGFDWIVEVGYKPGVTDNTGRTSSEAINDMLGMEFPVYTSRQYAIRGDIGREEVAQIASGLLANQQIERYSIKHRSEWKRGEGFEIYVPAVRIKGKPDARHIDLDVSDEELIRISREGVLALNLEEMRAIRDHFSSIGRQPTDAELETLAQTWSEHCKHKIFSGEITYEDKIIDSLFKTYIRAPTEEIRRRLGRRDWLVSVFTDNAGTVMLDDEYYIMFKVETHNKPSALDPYGGSITGIVGVNRDPMATGLGGRLAFNTDVFCFANPRYDGHMPSRLLHPRRVSEGVRRGVEHGGNKSGIPTVNGTVRFDSYPFGSLVENLSEPAVTSYLGNPLVYCGTGAVSPAFINGKPSHEKGARPGDYIVLVGGKTGADGIHGATFSSEGLHKGSPATAVQIGDPYTQKVERDFLLEARDSELYISVTDNGAGGLACSVGEEARVPGGAVVHLDKVPLKYPGLKPWEIMLSESQERMTLAVPFGKVRQFLELARRRGVEATAIGNYTDDGRFRAFYGRKRVSDLDMGFLHDGVPKKKMKAVWRQPEYEEPEFEPPEIDWALKQMLSRLNICSKERTVRQYDHEVQAQTVGKPLTGKDNDGPSDAAVLWPLEMQRKGSYRGISVSNGINPNYGFIDTYHMAASAMDEAIRNAVAVGADPRRIALLDNFCWSSSDDPSRLAQLVRACMALKDYSLSFGTPFISGKDSMFNDYRGELDGRSIKISVPPTLLISAVGIMPDIRKSATMDVKRPGNLLYVVGSTYDELGGSEYYAMMGQEQGKAFVGNKVPQVRATAAKRRYHALNRAINEGYVASCHDCSEGGIGVAASEMAFSGGYGISVELSGIPGRGLRDDYALFSESQSRLLAEVPPRYKNAFESLMTGPYAQIGLVNNTDYVTVRGVDGKRIARAHLQDLKDAWQKTLGV